MFNGYQRVRWKHRYQKRRDAQTDTQQFQQKYGAIVAKAWADEAFKQHLLTEPEKVLAEHGIEVPAGVEVRIVENTADVMYLTLPPKPAEELSDEQLSGVAAGGTCCCLEFRGVVFCCCIA